MGNVLKLNVKDFADKIKGLEVGEELDFATGYEGCQTEEDPINEADLTGWCGVKRISVFDHELVLIAEYGGGYSETVEICDSFYEEVEWAFKSIGADTIYVEVPKKKEDHKYVSVKRDGSFYLKGFTKCGESVIVPPLYAHKLCEEVDILYAMEDVKYRIKESEIEREFSEEDLRDMAKESLNRKSDCDGISETYWYIIDNVIKEFMKPKCESNKDTVRLGDKNVGDIVKIKENGTAVNFIVVHKGKPSSLYDSSCDGVWLLRETVHSTRAWDGTSNSYDNDYENSDIKAWLNGDYLNSIDEKIRAAIKTVKIPFKKGTGSGGGAVQSGANGLSCKVFLLSGYEVGFTTSTSQYFPVDGARLSYFLDGTGTDAKNKRIAKNSSNAAAWWWLRSPNTYNTYYAWYVSTDGGANYYYTYSSSGSVRPAFVLPSSLLVSADGEVTVEENNDVIYSMWENKSNKEYVGVFEYNDLRNMLENLPIDEVEICKFMSELERASADSEINTLRIRDDWSIDVVKSVYKGRQPEFSDGCKFPHCPVCNEDLDVMHSPDEQASDYYFVVRFCPYCGQKINWTGIDLPE